MKTVFLSLILFFTASLAANDCICIDLGAGFLFLQPSSSNLNIGAEAITLPVSSPRWKSFEIEPDYHLGFSLLARQTIDEHNTSLQFFWEHLWTNDSDSRTLCDVNNVCSDNKVGPFFDIGSDALNYKNAIGSVRHDYDAFHLHLDRSYSCDEYFKTNFFAGLDCTRIQQALTTIFSNADGSVTRTIDTLSKFVGIGPEVGVRFNYNLCENFFFTGKTSFSLLIGAPRNHTSFLSTSPFLFEFNIRSPNTQVIHVPHRAGVVPGFCGKLGLTYKMIYGGNILFIDVGYQVQAYRNAIQSIDVIAEETAPIDPSEVAVYALAFRRTRSNFALSGPYLSVSMEF